MKTFKAFLSVFIMFVSLFPSYSQKIDGWFKASRHPDSYTWGKTGEKYNNDFIYFFSNRKTVL